MAVGGDSAGGNLGAVVANEVHGLVFQLLVYPVTDLTMSMRSYEENADGYLLTRAGMEWFITHYLCGGGDPKDPRLAVLRRRCGHLGRSPGAGDRRDLDPLRDEGEAYAARLEAAGVATTHTRYDGQIHAFFTLAAVLPEAATAAEEATTQLRKAFASG